MRTCFLVPGLLGSTLHTDNFPAGEVWLSYTQIGLGRIGALRLAADGVNPGPPDGEALYPVRALEDYYGTCRNRLDSGLSAAGYQVRVFPWDWRKSTRAAGAALAAAVRGAATAADPCAIVAHSAGGLVARLAWSELAAAGQSSFVRRVVTLGTPHLGSYGVVRLWSLDLDQLRTMSLFTMLTAAGIAAVVLPFAPRPWSQGELSALASTWPALYETLPSLLGSDAAGDPLRSTLYSGRWPDGRGVSVPWLTYARDVYQPLLSLGSTLPPPAVLTTVAGTQYPTVDRLVHPSLLGNPVAYTSAGDGDGLVTVASALLPNSAQVKVTVAHADLPNVLALNGQLAELVLAERLPPDPPPPLLTVPGQAAPVLWGPPIPARAEVPGDC